MRHLTPLLAALAFSGFAAAAPAADGPLTEFPYTPGLDVKAMDTAADPCVDFYQYACGGWIKNNPIPADQPRWSVYGKLGQDNQRYLWGILDRLAKDGHGANPVQRKIGDYFAACMDEAAVEARGNTPLQPYLQQIAQLRSKKDLPALLGRLHGSIGDDGLFFGFGADPDFADSTRVIAFAVAGGIGLPDRDYYLKEDERSQTLRGQYLAHLERTFRMLGDNPEAARQAAERVMKIETRLARASLTRVERRDPYKIFHKMDLESLQTLTPAFDWHAYLRASGLKQSGLFNVTEPRFFKTLNNVLHDHSLPELQTYLRWHVTRAASPYLSSDYVRANFDFFSKTLRGVPELKPRWKRCVELVDQQLGEALGQEFVARAFSPELKASALRMTQQIEKAMEDDLRQLDWMSDATRKKALEKLHSIANKIGYPDKWREYRKLQVKRDDFFGNVERGRGFETRRQLAKIGKPVDRTEWSMTPPTVNAYYNPSMNDINFPAGVLQPPLFDPKMDAAPNYGNTGGTIGHELTHGFDDEGRQFDAKGNLKDWWTPADAKAFEERAQCIADQYAQYTVIDDVKINSKLTLGEDIADLGGLVLAWAAWKAETANTNLENRDGLTPEQRFFVGYAQWACENARPEDQRLQALTNPHSPGKYRVNGLVVNLPEFEAAFSCRKGQPMVAEQRCRVW